MTRLAVVGAGIMGANHARLAGGLRDAELACVVDPDTERVTALADALGVKSATSVHEVLDDFDAAIVATPTHGHVDVALELARAGKHLLVEKPLAPSSDEAERIVEAADAAGVVLMPGHVERFNPAVLELDNVLTDVLHVSTARISPYSPRVSVGVVLDLLIHDLDLVRAIVGGEVATVQAVTRSLRGDTEDLVSALLTFDNGVTADLTASRVGQQKIRTVSITQVENYVAVDLLRQDVTINRVDHSEFVSSEGARYRQSGVVEIPFLEQRGEPLLLEQREFVRAITAGTAPRVSGRDGVEALRLAERVLAAR